MISNYQEITINKTIIKLKILSLNTQVFYFHLKNKFQIINYII